jgi:hypothetical protein
LQKEAKPQYLNMNWSAIGCAGEFGANYSQDWPASPIRAIIPRIDEESRAQAGRIANNQGTEVADSCAVSPERISSPVIGRMGFADG